MSIGAGVDLKKWKAYADWKLLILLLLFLNVKLSVKVPAIILVYLLQFDFRFGFKYRQSRLPLFYLLMPVIALLGMLVNKGFQLPAYPAVFITGIFFWLLCLLAIHQVKLSVEQQDAVVIHHTLWLFFCINALFSLFNLLSIIWEIKTINPYLYQGQYQKYFISTGDYIKGLTFDTSTTNAVINALGILYFFVRKHYIMLLVCMVILLLTGSNFINIVVWLLLLLLFLFRSNRDQKSMIVVCSMLLLVFMAKVSPQNKQYAGETFQKAFNVESSHHAQPRKVLLPIAQRPDSLLNPDERKEKVATLYLDSLSSIQYLQTVKVIPVQDSGTPIEQVSLPQADINGPYYQHRADTPVSRLAFLQFIEEHKKELPYAAGTAAVPPLPGKVIGWQQTIRMMWQHPGKLITGNGMGNFSSKLAFRATGLGFAGGFPQRYTYINTDFMHNHLDLYLYFFSRQSGEHSLTNSPFSVYDQLLSEYGIPGVLVFVVCYLGFFWRHYKRLTYGLPVLLLMLAVFFVDYWFEQLSVLVLFELLLLLNIKETAHEKGGEAYV